MDPAIDIVDERFRPLVLGNAALEVLGEGARWLEGPVWFADHRCLYVSDLPNDRVLRWSEHGGLAVARAPAGFANGHARDREGRLLTCSHARRALLRTEPDGSETVLASHFAGRRLNSPNDVVCHSDGSIWFTDPTYGIETDYEGGKAEPELPPRLYRLDRDGSLRVMAADFTGPNGICFSPDESVLYVSETGPNFAAEPRACIRRFAVGADGTLSGGERFHAVAPGAADGFKCDDRGNLWTSAGDGVHCLSPEGELLGRIRTGATVSNLCFGGRMRSRLFICASTRLLAIYTNVRGALRP